MTNYSSFALFAAALTLSSLPVFAKPSNYTLYGKIHISSDYIKYQDNSDFTVSSNSSRFGLKGKKQLNENMGLFWKLESDIDVSGERGELKSRNRYVGLSHNLGKLIAGYHDSPHKSLGGKAGVFHDTIGERRGILGAANGSNKMNIRGKNSVLYISPKFSNVEWRVMRSAGDDTDSSLDEHPMLASSLVFDNKQFYVGLSYEDQSKPSVDAKGLRIVSGVNIQKSKINIVYEQMTSDTNDAFERNAYGISVDHPLKKLHLKAQVFVAEDYKNTSDSGAMLWAIGAEYKLDKTVSFYGLVAGVENDDNSHIPLAGSGHSEKYSVANDGDSLLGTSMGMVYKF